MKKLILLISLSCLVILYAFPSEIDRNQMESRINNLAITALNTESEPDNQTSEKLNHSQEKAEKTVYLTFDDGPTSATSEILDILHQFNATATFFMLEPAMKESPEVVKQIVEKGHAVGLHGVTHEVNHFYKSEQAALEEMTASQKTLQEITGIQSNLIRTPYGSVPYLTESFREVLDNNGFKVWDWNVDSSDWSLSDEEYVDRVIGQIEKLDNEEVTPIILMHDKQNTADHLSILLTYLSEHRFQTRKIEEDTKSYNFNCYQRCYRLSTQK
ncbi:polysaccharide deacetylase family protein [Sediminibacillus dalangtanensis]|uniref:Polysaccharide deacetylase family protein n=1 Tax=Sediminibacillus dalangtanensis TaxID=2729421 RepID=A0ABX7VVA9_9BACI|nr:polysaccharide deacetylase family protein [Sediminibacillus dalangtanensis]QTM98277.1 polysaccharide deacetylase family protein [Sediminibacillus dalangtanensis]